MIRPLPTAGDTHDAAIGVCSSGEWKAELERLAESWPGRDPGGLINDLCGLARAMGDDAAEALLDAHPELFDHAPRLAQVFRQRVLRKEKDEAQRLLTQVRNGPVPFADVASEPVLRSYNRVREIFDHLDFGTCSRFVMVGCGWVPETLFHVHDKTAVAEIVGLDIAPEAIETANALAMQLGYRRVRAELCDGTEFDYGDAEIVFLTNMVSPKSTILSRIAETAPPDVQIAVREPYSLRRLWSERGADSLDPRLEIAGWGTPSGTLSRDLFLKRRPVPLSTPTGA